MLPVPIFAADVGVQAAVVEGYSSNTYQTQSAAGGPVTRHPALYTGVQGSFGLRSPGRDTDLTELRVIGRAQHYESLDGAPQTDDGSAGALLVTTRALGENTRIGGALSLTLATLSSSHISDGTMVDFDPLSVRRTYWFGSAGASIAQEFARTWRYTQAVGTRIGGTLSQVVVAGVGALPRRDVDYVQPNLTSTIAKLLSESTTVDVTALFEYTYAFQTFDYAKNPPRDLGGKGYEALTTSAGWTRSWSEGLTTILRAGGTLATPGIEAPVQTPYFTPLVRGELFYTRDLWTILANAGYSFSSLNPRVGAGSGVSGGFTVLGRPIARRQFRELYLVAAGGAGRTTIQSGALGASSFTFVGASAEIRYGVSRWLGVVLGYDVHFVSFQSATPVPDLLRHLVFAGLSGYFSTDDTIPPVSTVTVPSRPGL